jgi:hypothetical protein
MKDLIIEGFVFNKKITQEEADLLRRKIGPLKVPNTWDELIKQFEGVLGRKL